MKRLLCNTLLILSLALPVALCGQATSTNLSFEQADVLAGEYYCKAVDNYAQKLESSWRSARLQSGNYQMPFVCYTSGECPEGGYPLYISMHGGGGTTAEVNDEQWENQKTLYGTVPGVYFVPRAPTDTWNMWHQEYMDDFLLQIVTYSVARLSVDPSRVYLLGYSAGGDGVYNLAARLSDRFAAAAMMAGHPGDAQIENLRNLPFAIFVGAEDTGYNRAGLAYEWLQSFEKLHAQDQDGYEYRVNIYADKGHWMDRLDGEAIGWLATRQRRSTPSRVIWIQDDILHTRKYNLEVTNPKQGFRIEEVVDYENNTIYINSNDYNEVTIWLDDYIADLAQPVVIIFNGQKVFEGVVNRLESNIIESVNARLDPEFVYWGKVTIKR